MDDDLTEYTPLGLTIASRLDKLITPGGNVARVGFVMQLKPGNEAIYKQKHDEIWPEMVETLQGFGIRNYSIFRRGLTLFAYFESDDPSRTARQDENPVVQRWWKMMAPYMEYKPDGAPWSEPIEEVFHLD